MNQIKAVKVGVIGGKFEDSFFEKVAHVNANITQDLVMILVKKYLL